MRGKDKLQSCEMQQFPSRLTETVLGTQKLLSCPEHSFSHGTSKGRNTYIYLYKYIKSQKPNCFSKCHLATSNTALSKEKPPINK